MTDWIELGWIGLGVVSITAVAVVLWDRFKRTKAWSGDRTAARNVILPFYEQLSLLYVVVSTLHSLFLVLHYYFGFGSSGQWELLLTSAAIGLFQGLWITVAKEGFATFLIQTSVSWVAWRRTVLYMIPYALLQATLWGGYRYFSSIQLLLIGNCFGASHYLLGVVYHQVVIVKFHYHREGVIVPHCLYYMIWYWLWASYFIAAIGTTNTVLLTILGLGYVIGAAAEPAIFFYVVRRDTKYWRALGTVPEFASVKAKRDRRWNTLTQHFTPELGMALPEAGPTGKLVHNLLEENRHLVVDFAFVQPVRSIARGGTAIVYEGRLYGKEVVAIKQFTPPELTSEDVLAFQKEMQLSSMLKHPNIVSYYGLVVRPPHIALLFEFCALGSLYDFLHSAEGSLLDFHDRLPMAVGAARAVAFLHSQSPPVLHRDVKSLNFFVRKNRTVALGDFGESLIKSKQLTDTQQRFGSILWMAPELHNNGQYTEKCDVYSLAIVLWEILTSQDPFSEVHHLMQVPQRVLEGQRPHIPDSTPSGYRRVLEQGWKTNIEQRWQAFQILDNLQPLLV